MGIVCVAAGVGNEARVGSGEEAIVGAKVGVGWLVLVGVLVSVGVAGGITSAQLPGPLSPRL